MKLDLNTSGPASKATGCGLIWEDGSPAAPIIDHAYCLMPWPAIPHYHETMVECYTVTSGTARVVIGERVHEVLPMDVLVISPGEVHFTVPHGRYPLQLLASNTPAWSSFDPPDFHLAECGELWRSELLRELAARNHAEPRELESLGDWQALWGFLCLPEYREMFSQVFREVAV